MKKTINIYVSLFLSIMLFNGCSDDFLDVVPNDQMIAENAFASEKNADLFLNDIYGSMPDPEAPFGYNYDAFENWGDNTVCKFMWGISWAKSVSRDYGANTYNPGLYNHDYPGIPFKYDVVFEYVRKCNLFLQQVEKHKNNFSEEWIKERTAEARFLRSFFYHWMWMAYGGLPIVTEVLNVSEQGDEIFKPRSTSEQTLDFITKELMEIAPDLKNEVGTGRATQGAAWALKGWCELFGRRYADAAESYRVIIEELNTYSLFQDGYHELFLTQNNNNSESIFAFQHLAGKSKSYRSLGFGPYSPTNGGWYCMQPTQNLVDDYVMEDGLPITQSSLYNPDDPFTGREPRFYQSIVYHGSEWQGNVYDMERGKPRRGKQNAANRGTYSYWGINPDKELQTGYYRRKGIDERLDSWTSMDAEDGANFMYFRYAGILLGYAEAKIEIGEIDQSVYDAINDVRTRGEIPTLETTYGKVAFSADELRPIVRRERRIELAFENTRYWDLIRWRTAEDVLNRPIYGMDIYYDEDLGKLVYDSRYLVHEQQFDKTKHYLFPIYQNWIDQNPEIKAQNGGPDSWVNGQNPGY